MNVPLTPIRFLYRAMDLFARKTGIVCGDVTLNYGEFGARALRLANALRKGGIEKGDRVAYLSFNNHQLMEGYYGVPIAGGIVMPLNVRLSIQELVPIINHSGAKLVIYENDFLPIVEQLKACCGGVHRFVTMSDYEELLASAEPDYIDFMDIDENAVAELFYTSGSTGTPKGVMLSHRTLYLHALSVATLLSDANNLVDLHTIPLFHANGWGRPQTSTMVGSKQVMLRRADDGQRAGECAQSQRIRSFQHEADHAGRRRCFARAGGAHGSGIWLRDSCGLRDDGDRAGAHDGSRESDGG
jgi:fatty-acyl-CoA synthase